MLRSILFLQVFFLLSPSDAQEYWVNAGLEGKDVDYLISGPDSLLFAGVYIPGVPARYLLYRTTDYGMSWHQLNDNLPQSYLLGQLFTDTTTHVYVAVDSQLSRLSHGDTTWSLKFSPGSGQVILSSACNSTGLIFVGIGPTIHRSTDYGESWELSYTPTEPNENVRSIVISKTGNIIASIRTFHGDSWVVRSTDGGANWTTISTFGYHFDQLVVTPSGSLLGFERSPVPWLFHSIDEGETWTVRDSSLGGERYFSLIFDESGVLYACGNGGVYYSINEGLDWFNITFNLPPTALPHSIAMSASGHLYVGTIDNGVWKSVQKVTAAHNSSDSGYPAQFTLFQNYPNPLNSGTTIYYSIPTSIPVDLQVIDILGRVITTFTNTKDGPGLRSVFFDASKLSSGVYFYSININGVVQTRKMVIQK